MHSKAVATIGITVLIVSSLVSPALAADDAWAEDPLDLIAFRDTVASQYSTGIDEWEVWECRIPSGTLSIDTQAAVDLLNQQITPYFRSLSGGTYWPNFRVGGTVESPATPSEPWFGFELDDCEQRVAQITAGGTHGALIIVNTEYAGGYASPGVMCLDSSLPCPVTYPNNYRAAIVGGGTVMAVAGRPQATTMTIAHEIGHTISWPHSYSGQTLISDRVWQYDNPMDLMSGGDMITLEAYTLAINRYAAGWLDPSQTLFHRQGSNIYQLGAIDTSSPQLLILPSDQGAGLYTVLSARVRSGYDIPIPKEGVEVYSIDQRTSACNRSWYIYQGDPSIPCFGTDRRTQQVPGEQGYSTAHVHGVGESFNIGSIQVTVLERVGDVFRLEVSGASVSERFIDDNGNPHEANISAIALAGITQGCNAPQNDRYCPGDTVTRAQIATFLIRFLGENPAASYNGYFPDVPSGAWYSGFVERAFELGLTTGYPDGSFRPDAPVTRAEMAAFIVKALGENLDGAPVVGIFSDIPIDIWYVEEAERMASLGITSGCSAQPLQYCPNDPARRDQMGTFLAKALALTNP